MHAGLPEAPREIGVIVSRYRINGKRVIYILSGLGLFLSLYFLPFGGDALDPAGNSIPLTREGKASLALFLLAAVWWVFEVVPVGITSIAIGVFQVLFGIRSAPDAFRDFMDPSVMFIFGVTVMGLALTKTGLSKRIAYKILSCAGESTGSILLFALVVTAGLSHIMAHTAAAATVFPVLLAIYALYGEGEKRTRFGKALFIGMAYAAGAGSIITLLGSGRAVAGAGLFKEFTGRDIGFYELTKYLFLVGWLMVLMIWGYLMIFLRPEKKVIHGLKGRLKRLSRDLGPLTREEGIVIATASFSIGLLFLQSFVPALRAFDRAALLLLAPLFFFLFEVLTLKDLEDIPWNIILLFSGALSIGFCLWETGAARWLAVNLLSLFRGGQWSLFVLSMAVCVMVMTNFIVNVAALALSLPVALAIAQYLGVAPDVVFYTLLVAAGMPFVLLTGAAPNAVAYEAGQFTPGDFFKHGIPMSILLLVVLGIALFIVWPLLGMPFAPK